MKVKLTQESLQAARGLGEGEVWDVGKGACPGFYARWRGGNAARWRYTLKYRRGKFQKHHRIGEDGGAIPAEAAARLGLAEGAKWSPEAARKEAERVRGIVRDGRDPDAHREIPTLRVFAARFLTEHMEAFRKALSLKAARLAIDKHLLPAFGDRRLDRITRTDVLDFMRRHKETPIAANRALATLSSLYGRALEWVDVGLPPGTNPARGVPRFKENRRTRFLSGEELARLGEALRAMEADKAVSLSAVACIRALLFTGCRPAELQGLRWEQVDLERGVLHLPDSKTGQKDVILNAGAKAVLAGLPHFRDEPRVFPPTKRTVKVKGTEHVVEVLSLASAWTVVRRRAQIADVRLYDACRHSFASIAVAGGASLYLVGGLLGHAKAATTQRYAHLGDTPLRSVAELVGAALAGPLAVAEQPAQQPADVVDLAQHRSVRRSKRGG